MSKQNKKEVGKMPIDFLQCKRCKKQWMPRVYDKLPIKCPYCQSRKWNEEKKEKPLEAQ